jgi:hypothetical protein
LTTVSVQHGQTSPTTEWEAAFILEIVRLVHALRNDRSKV